MANISNIEPNRIVEEIQRKYAGARGELVTLEALKQLDNRYIVLNQVLVPDRESSTNFREIDYVVIGPNACWIIEVKDYNGKIIGRETDDKWLLIKKGRGGTQYTESCRNPIRQVKKYVRLLDNTFENLRRLGYRVENVQTEGLVVFSRNNDISDIDSDSVSICKVRSLPELIATETVISVQDPIHLSRMIKRISDITKNAFFCQLPEEGARYGNINGRQRTIDQSVILRAQRAGMRPAFQQTNMFDNDGPLKHSNIIDELISDTTSMDITSTFSVCNINHEDSFQSNDMISGSSSGIDIEDIGPIGHTFDPTSYDMQDVVSPANIHHSEFFGDGISCGIDSGIGIDSCSSINSGISDCCDTIDTFNDPFKI